MMNTSKWGTDPLVRCIAAINLSVYYVNAQASPQRMRLPVDTITTNGLRLEDMAEDIERLATSLAVRFTDQSCVFLHTDELVAEAKAVLARVLRKGWLERSKSRNEFFRILKSSMNNRMKSVVQTYRFTQKRTGIKPVPKSERHLHFESTKPNEVSLDDPDSHLQVGDDFGGTHESDYDTRELVRELKARLNAADSLVFDLISEPPLGALILAELEARRGNPKNVKIRITHDHIIQTLEGTISKEGFQNAVLRIQQLYTQLQAMNPEDARYDAALVSLAALFNVQVPKSTPYTVTRRLFTIAARDNWKKVTPEVEAQLEVVGAISPKFDRDAMKCFGVLYQRGHKICESCGVKVACSTQAANVGLGEITINPKLLGAKLRRTPFILPGASPAQLPPTSNVRDMTIIDHLWRHFKKVTHGGETYLQLKEYSDKDKMVFCVGTATIPLRLRFCKPGPLLRKRLTFVNKGYYLKDDTSAEDAVAFIDEHVKYAYVN